MVQRLTDLSFDEWVLHIFDHEGTGPEWYFDIDSEFWDGPPETTVEYLTRLFEEPVACLQDYTDEQLNRGLWYVADNGGGNCMSAVLDDFVPLDKRLRCIDAVYYLFDNLFAQRCSPHLAHLDEPGANPLNAVCYMWWDIVPIIGQPEDKSRAPVFTAMLHVMQKTLDLESIACQESALHGLGHWRHNYPQQVHEIIDRFLMGRSPMRSELKRYAECARGGCVL